LKEPKVTITDDLFSMHKLRESLEKALEEKRAKRTKVQRVDKKQVVVLHKGQVVTKKQVPLHISTITS
jgi:hypothetical protein